MELSQIIDLRLVFGIGIDHNSLVSDIRVVEFVQHHAIDNVLRNYLSLFTPFVVVQDIFDRDSELSIVFNVIGNHFGNRDIVKAVFFGDSLSQGAFAGD